MGIEGGAEAMRPNVRRRAIALVAVAGTLVAGTAHAGTVTTTNACLYSINDEYRSQTVTLTGVGSPAGAAPGTPATLSGASLSATLPPSLPEQGYNLGIFSEGYNAIPSRVWIAIAASNATPAVQVKELSVVASTTIVLENGPGSEFVSGTPIVVTIPIPDTTWTVAAAGPVSFSQAGPGTLPSLPVGVDDKLLPVIGSIVVKPTLGTLRFVLDCQPGATAPPYTTVTRAQAPAFASLEAAEPVAPLPPPPPPPPLPPPPPAAGVAPRLAIDSPRAGVVGSRIGVAISCPPAGSPCRGRIAARSLIAVREGSRRRTVQIAKPRTYSVPAGSQRVVTLALTGAGRHLTTSLFRTLRVRVTLAPDRGAGVTRLMTLDRIGAAR